MGFQILRVKKIKSAVAVKGSLDHAHRERDTPNADASKTPQNEHLSDFQDVDGAICRFNELMPQKHRKDAVLALEYLITASPYDLNGFSKEKQDEYFQRSMEWLKERHGAQNIITAVVHHDETTAHLSVFVVPLVDGKLNAKSFTGGRQALKAMQDDFQAKVAGDFGLDRGTPDTHIHHIPQQKMYARLSQTFEPPEPSLLQKNKRVGFKDGIPKRGATAPSTSDRLTPHRYANREVGEMRETVIKIMSTEVDFYKKQAEALLPKAQVSDLAKLEKIRLRKKEKELDSREAIISIQEKSIEKIEQEKQETARQLEQIGYEKGFKVGVERSKADVEELQGNVKALNAYRSELTRERDDLLQVNQTLKKDLGDEQQAHTQTKKSLADLMRQVANAVPQKFFELQKIIRERIGWKPEPPKRDMGMGR